MYVHVSKATEENDYTNLIEVTIVKQEERLKKGGPMEVEESCTSDTVPRGKRLWERGGE